MKNKEKDILTKSLNNAIKSIDSTLSDFKPELSIKDIGHITHIGKGISNSKGLFNVKSEELVNFINMNLGIALNLDEDEVSIILLDEEKNLESGQEVYRTGEVMSVPVGYNFIGRIIDPVGRPLDDKGKISESESRPIEKKAPAIMERSPVNRPLQTGIQVIDSLIPIGKGQRELILGDRQTGKTAIAVDTIINQKDSNVICIYCGIGVRTSAISRVIEDLKKYDVIDSTIVMVATGEDTPGMNYIAPYAATSIAEFFMEQGEDVLIVYDDLTRHAWSYRELSLLMRRPPAREAYPGDIFYIHSRLLERSTQLKEDLGGGSITSLPIIETQAQNISAYIPTNLISITDGQIYLNPNLFQTGLLPAIDVGKSVSRVGGKAQLPIYRKVSGDLKLSYSQFEELESFSKFGTRLDEETRKTLEHGKRVRETFKQSQYSPIPVPEQLIILLSVSNNLFDNLPLRKIEKAKTILRVTVKKELPDLYDKIENGDEIKEEEINNIIKVAKESLSELYEESENEE